jgi:hypothetical protein
LVDPATLITPGAIWSPGAWTPARCELWDQSDAETRKRLESWIMAEAKRGTCHREQLPNVARAAA